MDMHEQERKYPCDVCGKQFVLEWKLKKHANVHEENTKLCNYFICKKSCPYEDIGCKYSHDDSDKAVGEDEGGNIEEEE